MNDMRFVRALTKKQLWGRVCLVRVDFNVDNPKNALRMEATIPTLRFLLARGARLLIASHYGRPSRRTADLSLRFVLPFLKNALKSSITFLETIPDSLPSRPRIFLLENLRFWSGEVENDAHFARSLAALADYYVNDAFAVSHRANASVVRLPKMLPSYAGLLLEKEFAVLSGVMRKPKKPLVLVFGGVKVADKLPAIKKLLPRTNAALLGSSSLQRGVRVPQSPKIYLPQDWVSEKNEPRDIGPMTIAEYAFIIRNAKTVIWNGPLGQIEKGAFRHGSAAIARAIAKSRAFSIAGGGETTQMIKAMRLEKKFNFLSTGGGAMLDFLAGKKLPGITALE